MKSSDPRMPAPCGSWPSPITADSITSASTPIDEIAIRDGVIYWTERRPLERGRTTLMRMESDGAGAGAGAGDGDGDGAGDGAGVLAEMTPAPTNVRSRVHEYGGGAFSVGRLGVFVVSFDDQQIHRIGSDGAVSPLTSIPAMRFAEAIQHPSRNRLIAVREDHSSSDAEAVNTLVAIDAANGEQRILAGGHDFISSPALSPDGQQLAWLTWDHPNMPWDGTDLWVASIDAAGELTAARHVAGGRDESVFQPAWSPSGELHFVSDRSGWWNLYRVRGGAIDAIHPMAAEFGVPQWTFALRTYGFDARGDVVAAYSSDGEWNLARVRTQVAARGGALEPLSITLRNIRRVVVDGDRALVLGGSPVAPERLVRFDLASGAETLIRASTTASVDPAWVSVARPFSFATSATSGTVGGAEASTTFATSETSATKAGAEGHAFHYRPTNPGFVAGAAERPPLIVMTHGGPTGATNSGFNWTIQFWTSRGFAVVDVNYGGSAGYGRAYRNRLRGQWGVVDVDDAVNAARHLVAAGEADGKRVAIRGGSAGGYTTLCALTFRDFFKAGASYYGIGDLESLARDTHKFESRYLDSLIGPYPEAQALYAERSPIHHTGRLSSPMILFQGSDDKAVPPNQAQSMYEAVRAKGLPVACLLFDGEGHGFRRAENLVRSLEAELYFYGRIFGFTPADSIEPVVIDNLDM